MYYCWDRVPLGIGVLGWEVGLRLESLESRILMSLNKMVIEIKQSKVLEDLRPLGGKKVSWGLTPWTLPPKSLGSVVLILGHCPKDTIIRRTAWLIYDEPAHMSPWDSTPWEVCQLWPLQAQVGQCQLCYIVLSCWVECNVPKIHDILNSTIEEKLEFKYGNTSKIHNI